MKKSIILLLAMVCTITACQEPQIEEVRDIDNCSSHYFCIETSFPSLEADNAETRSSIQPKITLKWSDGDLISVVNLTTGKNLLGDLVARVNDDQVYFEGDLSGSVRTGDKLAAIYPSQNYTGISNITDIAFDLSAQTCSSMNEVPFCAYSLFTCKTVGVVNVESPFIIPVSFNQIAISNIEPNTKIEYIELSNVGNNLLFTVNKSTGTLDLTSTTGKVRITPEAKQSGDDGSLFAYCALAESKASDRSIVVKALPNIYTAEWAKSVMSTSKYYTSIASDFTVKEYKDFMVSEPSSLEVGAEGGKLIFNVSSENKDWTVSSVPNLDITPSSGSSCENLEVVVNIPKNEGFSEMAYLITFEATDFKYTFSIKQDVLASNKHIEFPDINLKKYLLSNYDLNDDGGISEDEAEGIIMVNCSDKGVWDLTGLEACTNLATLNCSNNGITEIELPNLTQLRTVTCNDCPIERMNFDGCSSLQYLNLQSVTTNAISGTAITIDGYTQADILYFTAKNTPFTSFTFKNTSALTTLELYGEFTDVIVTKNTALTSFVFYAPVVNATLSGNSLLEVIDVSSLLNLKSLDVQECKLLSLDVTKNLALTSLICNNNELTTINVSNNTLLMKLYCSNNKLPRINLTTNTALKELDIASNLLSVLNVRNNTALKYLCISNNAEISMVDVKLNTALEVLVASGLAITDIDLTANTALKGIELFNENLTAINKSATAGVGIVFEKKTPYSNGKMMSLGQPTGILSEAKTWCSSYGTGWYLPSIDELRQIYNNKSAINSVLSDYDYCNLGTGSYWSSTNKDDIYQLFDFSNGEAKTGAAKFHHNVRAVFAW